MPPTFAQLRSGPAHAAAALLAVAFFAACISTPSPNALVTTPTPTWATFHEPTWGYSIQIPPGWNEIKAGDPRPQEDRDFSNEAVTNISTLAGLDEQGVFFRIAVTQLTPACPRLPGPGTPNFMIVIDGYPATALLFDDGQEFSTELSAFEVEATTDKYCYSFVGLTRSTATRDAFLPTVDQMLSTFRFGTPQSPPF